MIINIGNIKDLLNSNLSVLQRGLLMTAILVRDDNPKFTLAKLKSTIKIKEYNQDLIYLHEAGYIKWSGYASAKRSEADIAMDPDVINIISFMNKLCNRNFNVNSESSTKELRNRLLNNSIEDIKRVITNRYAEWKDDAMMSKHLNPTTIFRASKFDKYLEEANRTKVGQSLLTADQINLTQGAEIVFNMCKNLLDKDVYKIKTYDVDPQGNRITSGMSSKVYGHALKKMLKTQNNRVQNGFSKEFEYIYQEQ